MMRSTAMLLLAGLLLCSQLANAQQRITIRVKDASLSQVFAQLRTQTGFSFIWNQQLLEKAGKVNLDLKNVSLKETMDACLNGTSLNYEIREKVKVVYIRSQSAQKNADLQEQLQDLQGKITDDKGVPLPGANIILKGSSRGTVTDGEGRFLLRQVTPPAVIVVSMLGYQTLEIKFNGQPISAKLSQQLTQMSEVTVSTGIYTRKRESFTGSFSVYTGEQLKTIGNQNVIQSLRTLDPSFQITENNVAGSNPNVMPNMSIQGKTSMIGSTDQLKNDPNQPLFILDGFETDIATIIGLDINRVASITILKDAASTAIYGSKAANGVVVVETKLPRAGKINLTFNSDNTISFPDLRDYNMMNAAEILEFQRQAGVYSWDLAHMDYRLKMDSLYNERLNNVRRGVNTYWMGIPLKSTAWSQNYSLYADGGEGKFRYGLGFKYGRNPGVMIGSGRNTGNASVDLIYRTGKLNFSNQTLVTTIKGTESPYGSFSQYVKAMPYYETDTAKFLEQMTSRTSGEIYNIVNPLYQIDLPNKNESRSFKLANRFSAYYQANKNLRVDARFMATQSNDETELLRAPENAEFDSKDIAQRGKYIHSRNNTLFYQAFLQASYGAVFNKHEVNAVGGGTIENTTAIGDEYTATGFPSSPLYQSPAYATAYPEAGTPSYSKAIRRALGGFLNAHYGYDRRFMIDFNIRKDGSSIFGASKRYSNTWTTSAAWNLHNEAFFKRNQLINFLQLRASIGNPGNQSFSSYNSFTTLNYYPGRLNDFGSGMTISGYGNTDLAWQKTINKTLGFDARVYKERINIQFNLYDKYTDPLVVSLSNAPSVGTTTQMVNMGNMHTRGFDFAVNALVLSMPKERFYWRVNVSGAHYKSTYGGLGNKLEILNKNNAAANGTDSLNHSYASNNLTLQRYYDGASPEDLWAVRSLGIDPATGKELFLTKSGEVTFVYNANDVVRVGNSQPAVQGIIGTSFQIKGFTVGANLRYLLKSNQFNSALYNKVENLSIDQIFTENLDKRAFYERWKNPGDISQFRAVGTVTNVNTITSSPMSSRFIQEENTITGESINFGYDFHGAEWLKNMGMQGLRLTGYMNDIFRLSTLRRERGIDYPYARSFSFSLNASF